MNALIRSVCSITLLLLLSSCAHQSAEQLRSAHEALKEVCSIGSQQNRVTGSVWLKARSPDIKGQFPAFVKVTNQQNLQMEVTNLIGSPQANINVNKHQYEIILHGPKKKIIKGKDNWAGIPLRWATSLFLGRIPCPNLGEEPKVRWHSSSIFSAVQDQEEYRYFVRRWAGQAWPEKLIWKSKAKDTPVIEFVFEKPKPKTTIPLKWSISTKNSQVKVRWKRRMD